jgi:hypothetical protein
VTNKLLLGYFGVVFFGQIQPKEIIMINFIKVRTPIIVLILFVFAIGNAFAEKVVVIPLGSSDVPNTAQFSGGDQSFGLTVNQDDIVRSITINAPVDGTILITASGGAWFKSANWDRALGSITDSTTVNVKYVIAVNDFSNTLVSSNVYQSFAGTRGFKVVAGTYIYNLVFHLHAGSIDIRDSNMTAIFIPDSVSTILPVTAALSVDSANNCDLQDDDCP